MTFRKKQVDFQLSTEQLKLRNKMLFYALGWMCLGLFIVFLMTFSILAIPAIANIYFTIFVNTHIGFVAPLVISLVSFFVYVAIIRYISRNAYSKNLGGLVTAYVAAVLITSFWIPALIIAFAAQSKDAVAKLMLALAVPVLVLAIAGFLGYFGIINFARYTWLITALLISSIAIGIISYFIFNSFLYAAFSVIGIIVSFLIIGFTFQIIKAESEQIIYTTLDEQEMKSKMLKGSIIHGLNLFISFIRIFIALLELTKN
ncbi:MAG0110 family membrane protein [Mycoplasma procyoni]|uniref:MAG0110 family membrane protein n=1 Tax=Mycoplasma procyoni TaxID=568784 RepID=UPI00197BCA82|nr:Bax inhibitor-1 family protein [Mycoplasma procyoni]MBN3534635.1 Bax inhibitor-1/YccA family protein [Mycoplasma procyoni]